MQLSTAYLHTSSRAEWTQPQWPPEGPGTSRTRIPVGRWHPHECGKQHQTWSLLRGRHHGHPPSKQLHSLWRRKTTKKKILYSLPCHITDTRHTNFTHTAGSNMFCSTRHDDVVLGPLCCGRPGTVRPNRRRERGNSHTQHNTHTHARTHTHTHTCFMSL